LITGAGVSATIDEVTPGGVIHVAGVGYGDGANHFVITGTFADAGNGAYAGIAGTLNISYFTVVVLPRKDNGQRGPNSGRPLGQVVIIEGAGTVSFKLGAKAPILRFAQ
jgi:hypothetical protein